ncbi:MAG: hypothetical protein PHC83_04300, partial [Bacteroidales bacterium]|nr:hypothetical protein [Bacteroidales bacterium]
AMSRVHILLIKAAYKLSLTEKGDAIAETIISNLHTMRNSSDLSTTDKDVIRYTVRELKKIIRNPSILENLDTLMGKL